MATNKQDFRGMDDTQSPKDDRLSYDKQVRLRNKLNTYAKARPLNETILYKYGPEICVIPTCILTFLSWRAGFRGYSLHRFGKVRLISIVTCLPIALNGFLPPWAMRNKMAEPYCSESPWYYGWRAAVYHQFGIFSCTTGPLAVTFLYASKLNLLPIPDGMHKPGVREIAAGIFYARVKPYLRNIAMTAVATTAITLVVTMSAFNQSRKLLLAGTGHRTISLREEVETQV